MDILSVDPLDDFSPEHYVAVLSEVAHSDGLDAEEQVILEQYALRFEVDLDALPEVPADLSNVAWSTRILVYRDTCMLASADGSVSSAEESTPRRPRAQDAAAAWRHRIGSSVGPRLRESPRTPRHADERPGRERRSRRQLLNLTRRGAAGCIALSADEGLGRMRRIPYLLAPVKARGWRETIGRRVAAA